MAVVVGAVSVALVVSSVTLVLLPRSSRLTAAHSAASRKRVIAKPCRRSFGETTSSEGGCDDDGGDGGADVIFSCTNGCSQDGRCGQSQDAAGVVNNLLVG